MVNSLIAHYVLLISSVLLSVTDKQLASTVNTILFCINQDHSTRLYKSFHQDCQHFTPYMTPFPHTYFNHVHLTWCVCSFKAGSSERALCWTGCGEFPRTAGATSQTPCSFHRHRLNPAPNHISTVTTLNQTPVHPPVSSCHILDVTSASAVRCRGVHQETCGGKITTHVLEGHITDPLYDLLANVYANWTLLANWG